MSNKLSRRQMIRKNLAICHAPPSPGQAYLRIWIELIVRTPNPPPRWETFFRYIAHSKDYTTGYPFTVINTPDTEWNIGGATNNVEENAQVFFSQQIVPMKVILLDGTTTLSTLTYLWDLGPQPPLP